MPTSTTKSDITTRGEFGQGIMYQEASTIIGCTVPTPQTPAHDQLYRHLCIFPPTCRVPSRTRMSNLVHIIARPVRNKSQKWQTTWRTKRTCRLTHFAVHHASNESTPK